MTTAYHIWQHHGPSPDIQYFNAEIYLLLQLNGKQMYHMIQNCNPFTVISKIPTLSYPFIDKQKFSEENMEVIGCNVVYLRKERNARHIVMFSTR